MTNIVNIFTILFNQVDIVFLHKNLSHILIPSSHSDHFKMKSMILAASLEVKEINFYLRSIVKW